MHFTVVVQVLTVCHLVRPLSLAQRRINLSNWNSQISTLAFNLSILRTLNSVFIHSCNYGQGECKNIYLCAQLDSCQGTQCQCCAHEEEMYQFSILFHFLLFYLK